MHHVSSFGDTPTHKIHEPTYEIDGGLGNVLRPLKCYRDLPQILFDVAIRLIGRVYKVKLTLRRRRCHC